MKKKVKVDIECWWTIIRRIILILAGANAPQLVDALYLMPR